MKTNKHLLEEAFPIEYINNGLNATRAYKSLKKNATDATARTEGSKLLAKPNIQEHIRQLLPTDAVEAGVIRDALHAKPFKGISWAEKHRYLETSLKLKGYMTDRPENSTNIAMIITER